MDPENDKLPEEDAPLPEKKKKEVISVYLAIFGFLLILASFFWNLFAALDAKP